MTSYPYHFEEGTDSHSMIMKSSVLTEIAFDEKRSEPEALATLRGLKPEVLYPNASGKITLQGSLRHPDLRGKAMTSAACKSSVNPFLDNAFPLR